MGGSLDRVEQFEKTVLVASDHAFQLADAEAKQGSDRTGSVDPRRSGSLGPAGEQARPAFDQRRDAACRQHEQAHLAARRTVARSLPVSDLADDMVRIPQLILIKLVEEAAPRAAFMRIELTADRRDDRDLESTELLGEGARRRDGFTERDEANVTEGDRLALTAWLAIPDQPAEPRAADPVAGGNERAEA
jgi:hypothetical protein